MDITKTRLFKYIEKFHNKISDIFYISAQIIDYFHISDQNIDCVYSLGLPR